VPDETPDWLSAEDASILALESPVVAGHTCKVIELAAGSDRFSLDDLRSHIRDRLDAAPRLRRKLDPNAPPLGRPAWVEDPEFHVGRHVFALPIARPLDGRGLRDDMVLWRSEARRASARSRGTRGCSTSSSTAAPTVPDGWPGSPLDGR